MPEFDEVFEKTFGFKMSPLWRHVWIDEAIHLVQEQMNKWRPT